MLAIAMSIIAELPGILRDVLLRIPDSLAPTGPTAIGLVVLLVAIGALVVLRTRSLLAAVVCVLAVASGVTYFAWNADILPSIRPPIRVPRVTAGLDTNANGIDDYQDIVDGARRQIKEKPKYKSAYYDGGYPPDNEGVCTDLVWRALWHAGYDLKASVDSDIAEAPDEYPRVAGSPDPNIDFRRVPNLYVFLTRWAQSLTTEVKPWDQANAEEWQPGDIVVFGNSYDHIGIVSDKRRKDGMPLVIHHGWGRPVENNALGRGKDQVTGHFRLDLSTLSVREDLVAPLSIQAAPCHRRDRTETHLLCHNRNTDKTGAAA
ncbi:MAG: DUF1287 domain-containing protein [Bacillota bacterium]|jgi:uncharacterized protein YijF (DUF1287 family)